MPRRLIAPLLILTVGVAGCSSYRNVDLADPGGPAGIDIDVNDSVTVITHDGTRIVGRVRAIEPDRITIVEMLYRNREETVIATADIASLTVQESKFTWLTGVVGVAFVVTLAAWVAWQIMWSGLGMR